MNSSPRDEDYGDFSDEELKDTGAVLDDPSAEPNHDIQFYDEENLPSDAEVQDVGGEQSSILDTQQPLEKLVEVEEDERYDSSFEENRVKGVQLKPEATKQQSDDELETNQNLNLYNKLDYDEDDDSESRDEYQEVNARLRNEIERLREAFNKHSKALKKERSEYKFKKDQVEDPFLQKQNKELTKHSKKTKNLKQKIREAKFKLRAVSGDEEVTELENELQNKVRIVNELTDETQSLMKVQKDMNHAMHDIDVGPSEDTQEKTKQMVVERKRISRALTAEIVEEEKALKEHHSLMIKMEDRIRRMNEFIKLHKKNPQDRPEKPLVSLKEQIVALNEEISQIEQENKQNIRKVKDDLQVWRNKRELQEEENQILNLQVREKEQEIRLNQMKVSEIRKGIPNNRLRPLAQTRYSEGNKAMPFKKRAARTTRVIMSGEQPKRQASLTGNGRRKGDLRQKKRLHPNQSVAEVVTEGNELDEKMEQRREEAKKFGFKGYPPKA